MSASYVPFAPDQQASKPSRRWAERDMDLIVSMGREGRDGAKIDEAKQPHTAMMAERLRSEAGRAACHRRRDIVEPPNESITHLLGFRQFS